MKNLKAYFAPHPPLIISAIGKGEEKAIQKTIDAYHEIAHEIAEFKPETIIFISPHASTYHDYFHIASTKTCSGSFAQFYAPQINFNYENDLSFVKALSDTCEIKKFPAGVLGSQNGKLDHGILIPLYFINKYYQNFKIICLSFSWLDKMKHFEYGRIIQDIIKSRNNQKYVVIASGDLSHYLLEDGPYGFQKEGPIFDKIITDIFASGKLIDLFEIDEKIIEKAGECGYRSALILAGILSNLSLKSRLLSYQGTFGVGYAVASFSIANINVDRR
ncbi:MAG: AmmeMemoRadiSam system protein B [Bacilli bacterium]|jgi:aromatic ring-opening dioxygenase LigB subunit|nr:AmmeMemoRadiSam system protein B [Bacilli bacterium]